MSQNTCPRTVGDQDESGDVELCNRPAPDAVLCPQCISQLRLMFDALPGKLADLEVTRLRMDRLTTGRTAARHQGQLSALNFGASQLAWDVEHALAKWCSVLKSAKPTDTTAQKARRLSELAWVLASRPEAAEVYAKMASWCGDPETPQQPGLLTLAVDRRPDRICAGHCSTLRGRRRDGTAIECGEILMVEADEPFVSCPKCGHTYDVVKNRQNSKVVEDLKTDEYIVELLHNIDEPLGRDKKSGLINLRRWIRAGKIQRRGFVHRGRYSEKRVSRGDTPLYSISQVQMVRWAELAKKEKRAS